MNDLPDISVVIPTLNRPERLLRAIKSLDNQTYKGKIICIVVDSSIDDSSEQIINNTKFSKSNLEINYIKNNDSIRPIDNWIIGIEEFKSELGKFLCDDDWLHEEFIQECVSVLQTESVDCVITDINVVKTNKTSIDNYYNVEKGKVARSQVVKSFLGLDKIIPVTPTASLLKTNVLVNSFYESLKHIECTKNLFGFDFFMSYFSVFNSNGTFLIEKGLSYSSAGDDSMTLNVKKAKISYCYFFALINLINSSDYKLSQDEEAMLKHKLATFNIKKIFSNDYKVLEYENKYQPKLIMRKLISSQLKSFI